MEDKQSKSRMLMTLYVMQMLLISAVAQGPATSPAASPNPSVAPSKSPPAPPSEPPPVDTPPPAEAPIPVQRFSTNTSFALTVGNGSFTGRQTKVALSSPNGLHMLVLIMDGFGTESSTQYCWTEVHDMMGNLTFRENCGPIQIQKCTLSLTEKGDMRLTLESRGGKLVSWNTDTENDGVTEVKVDDTGVLTLVKADDTVVWTSAGKDMCLEPFDPANGSAVLFGFSKLLIVCSVILSFGVSNWL